MDGITLCRVDERVDPAHKHPEGALCAAGGFYPPLPLRRLRRSGRLRASPTDSVDFGSNHSTNRSIAGASRIRWSWCSRIFYSHNQRNSLDIPLQNSTICCNIKKLHVLRGDHRGNHLHSLHHHRNGCNRHQRLRCLLFPDSKEGNTHRQKHFQNGLPDNRGAVLRYSLLLVQGGVLPAGLFHGSARQFLPVPGELSRLHLLRQSAVPCLEAGKSPPEALVTGGVRHDLPEHRAAGGFPVHRDSLFLR